MARGVLRRTDINLGFGLVMPTQTTVIVNGRPAARMGDPVFPHKFPPFPPKPVHPINVVLLGNFNVVCVGKPIARRLELELLRHPFITASTDVVTL